MMETDQEMPKFDILTHWGAISSEQLNKAKLDSRARGVSLERLLLTEKRIPKYLLLQALSKQYDCPYIEYDERLPIPPELLKKLDAAVLSKSLWMPVIRSEDGTVVIAANDPESRDIREECLQYLEAERYEFRVALEEDIRWFIQDFLHDEPGHLTGTERTDLAYWRTTMAQWRTRLACYRTELAEARSGLAYLRWGLGTIAIADALFKREGAGNSLNLYIYSAILVLGLVICSLGLPSYLRVRKSRMSPPQNQTIVKVTSATIRFLEAYHYQANRDDALKKNETMLARLSSLLADYCTILYPSSSSKIRTMYVHERNVLAAQRTVAACYRTIYSRARTGLAFIRTGISYISIGIGLIIFFGRGLFTVIDIVLGLAGTLMIIDGGLWYLPVRKEQAEIPRSIAFK